MIIEVLELEDITAAEIDPEAPLFVEGLGLTPSMRLNWAWPSTSVTGSGYRLTRRIAGAILRRSVCSAT
jgi:hypothetical protein